MADRHPQFYSKAAVLDSLASDPDPGDDVVKLVAQVVTEERSLAEHFFRRLENPAWLEPLYEEGVFRRPPSCVRTAAGVECPPWGACSYLTRMAPIQPDIVVRVARDMDTDNPRVYLGLIEAATKMPPGPAATVVPAVVRWLSRCDPWLAMLAAAAQELMVHLAEHEEVESALQLLEALTEPKIRERSIPLGEGKYRVLRDARPRYSSWYLKQLIERRLPALSALDALGVTGVLEAQLRKCIEMERRDLPGRDGSYLWRSAIEDHPQNRGQEDLKNILTVGLRDSLEFAVRSQPEVARPIIERYLEDDLSIFRRLALHLLRLGGDQYGGLAAGVLQDSRFRDNERLHHEYYRLLEDRFGTLPQEAQLDYLNWIEQGPDFEGVRSRAKAVTGKSPAQEDITRHIRRWQLEHLMPVRDALTGDWSARYETLVEEFGQPEHAEFHIWSSATWVGPTSPRSKDELGSMGATDALDYLKTFQPTEDFFNHSREGLARELEAVVKEDPASYLRIAHSFLAEAIHPTYVYHLVTGLHEAWKDGTELDWSSLLAFFEPISLALAREGPGLADAAVTIDDIGWPGVRMAICRFLAGALHRDDRVLPPQLMPNIRDMLLRFIQDPDPTPEDEKMDAQTDTDWVNVRINTGRGVAASALLEYALRYARMHKAEHEPAEPEGGHPCRFEQAARDAFTRMLDKTKEASAAVHSLFGECLPNFLYLDHDWTADNLNRIFPTKAEYSRYWEAAWEGYMLYSPRVYRELYEMLRPQYSEAVDALARADSSPTMRRNEHALAQHIAIAYRMGYEELAGVATPLDTEGSLLPRFLEGASDELRATLVRGLGTVLRADEQIAPEDWARLRKYWAARGEAVFATPSGYEMDQELSAFAWWLDGVPEGLDTLVPLLQVTIEHLTTGHNAHEILDFLSSQSEKHPAQAVDMLIRLLERQAELETRPPQDRMYLIGAEGEITKILQTAVLAAGEARQLATSVVNMLGERGQYEYRDLLTQAH